MDLIPAKTILSGYREGNLWFGVNYNMNIYKGCCHGCIYCDSRSECYGVEEFDRVRAKADALKILAGELKAKRRRGVVGTGAMSDPYNPLEKEFALTRGALAHINDHKFGIAIATKSDLVTRDTDLLTSIREHSPVLVKVTVTTCDDKLCRKIEPQAPPSSRRFAAIEELSRRGICCGILLMPVLPFLEDHEDNIRGIIRLAKESGAKFIYPMFGVTLRQNQRLWYYLQLDKHFPGLKQQYIDCFGAAYECRSPRAKQLWQLFKQDCEACGIVYQMDEIIALYKRGYAQVQSDLQPVLFE